MSTQQNTAVQSQKAVSIGIAEQNSLFQKYYSIMGILHVATRNNIIRRG